MTSSSGRRRARQGWSYALPECPVARASAKSRAEEALSIPLTQSPRRPNGNGKLCAETTTRMDSAVSTTRIPCAACDVRDVDYKKPPTEGHASWRAHSAPRERVHDACRIEVGEGRPPSR